MPHCTLERPRVPSVGTPWTVPQGSLLSHYALWGQSSCPSLVTGNPCCGFVGQAQVTASHPKPSVGLLWAPLPKSQGKIQGSKAISIQFPVSFSIGTFFFLNLAPNMLPKAMFRLSWITTVKYYSCTVPNLALACSDKTLLCIL